MIGSQTADIKRDPNRLTESAMGNLITDAMVEKYPEVDGAYTNSGGLRAGPRVHATQRDRRPVRDHLGRDVRGAAVRQLDGHPDADR